MFLNSHKDQIVAAHRVLSLVFAVELYLKRGRMLSSNLVGTR